MKKTMYIFLIIIAILVVGGFIFLNLPRFGKKPSGERLARIEKSVNYKDGKFHNLEETPQLTAENKSFFTSLYEYLFENVKDLKPSAKIPSVKTDLHQLENNRLVWLGHSSYFLKINGKNILIDPVFNPASPVSFMIKPFDMEYNYTAKDIPDIDLLVITHDHWDHLDYQVMKEIRPRVKAVVTTLGVGSHLEYWDFEPSKINELDWNDEITLDGMKLTCLPTRHFSGRGIIPTKTLWGSFMLEVNNQTIYIGSDSGYGTHIAEIGKQFPNIDLVLLENGQYNEDWRYIHFLPEKLHQTMKELGAKRYFTGHNSKFALAKHAWYEPLESVRKVIEKDTTLNIITPKIGEIVDLNDENQAFEYWWEEVK